MGRYSKISRFGALFLIAVMSINIIVLSGIFTQTARADSNWLGDWAFRKSHTINAAVGAGSGYQVQIIAHYGSGNDSGSDVYCGSSCRIDFGDLRFTSDDGASLLSFWMQEKVDGSYAVFWVKIGADLSVANATIYMYYGKSDATTTSNGDNTFIFFDHFDGTTLDASKWVVRQGDVSVADSELVLTANTSYAQRGLIDGLTTFGPNTAVHTRARLSQLSTITEHFCSMRQSGSWDNRAGDAWTTGSPNQVEYETVQGNYSTGSVVSLNNVTVDHLYMASWASGGSKFYQDSVLEATNNENVPSVNMVPVFYEGQGTGQCYVDWVFVSKWVDIEPTQGAWGPQEQLIKPDLFLYSINNVIRKFGESFSIKLNISEPYNTIGVKFEIHFNSTMLNCSNVVCNEWQPGTVTVDEVNGVITGSTSGDPVTGNHLIATMTFQAIFKHIWKAENTMPGWKNNQTGAIFVQWANMSYPGGFDLRYEKGGLNQINVGPNATCTWFPIKGDVNNDGRVDILDLISVANYVNVKQGDPLWPLASKYDLTNVGTEKAINVLDMIIVASNYWYVYDP